MPEGQDRISRRRRARAIVAARLEKLEDISISKLVPSTLTLLALCSGMTAIRFALAKDWRTAVMAVVFAMIFDMLDGRAARMLGADTRFGAQLDSLADLVNFGVAPGVILYVWSLSAMGNGGWIAALIFCAASAVRLARFNVQSARDEGATNVHPYFTGLPTPAAACLLLLPLLLSFQLEGNPGAMALVQSPILSAGLVALTSVLMVSRLPTPSIKYMRVQRKHRLLVLLAFAGLIALLILYPWATLTVGLAIYAASIPLAALTAHPRRKAAAQ